MNPAAPVVETAKQATSLISEGGVIGLLVLIVVVLLFACVLLWRRNNELADKLTDKLLAANERYYEFAKTFADVRRAADGQ
jgi:hypothetical protein